jgi:hypothetical protein
MKQLRVEREASYRGGVWSSPAAGPGRGREFRWDLRGPRSSPRGTGGGGGRGDHKGILGRTTRSMRTRPRPGGSRELYTAAHHQSSSQPVTTGAERRLLLGSGSVRA